MSAADPAKKLTSLIKRLKSRYADARLTPIERTPAAELPQRPENTSPEHPVASAARSDAVPIVPPPQQQPRQASVDSLVHELVFSMLLWEASTGQARAAFKRLRESLVDYNELRVCLASEIAELLGENYPLALERSDRLRSALSNLYKRRHRLELAHLLDGGKREGREYLMSLEGVPPFVMSRVCLVHLDAHGIPLDGRLCDLLAKEKAIDVSDSTGSERLASASSWLDRQVHAGEAPFVHAVLQAWSDERGQTPKRDRATSTTPATILIAAECETGRAVIPTKRAASPPRRAKTPSARVERDTRRRARPAE
jgi:hypothetical protein